MVTNHRAIFLLAFFYSCAAFAGETELQRQSSGVVSYVNVLQWMLGLIVVLAIFGGLVRVLRKVGRFSFDSRSQLAVISGISIGMREKLVLVKVGEKQLLLGVTPGRVDKLLELEGDERLFQTQGDTGDSGMFAKKLQQVLQGKTDA